MQADAEIAMYEKLDGLHDQMLAAVAASAWDDLTKLESESAQITESLKRMPSSFLTTAAKERKRALIRGILDKQGKIRDEVTAWRRDVEPLLSALDGHTAP